MFFSNFWSSGSYLDFLINLLEISNSINNILLLTSYWSMDILATPWALEGAPLTCDLLDVKNAVNGCRTTLPRHLKGAVATLTTADMTSVDLAHVPLSFVLALQVIRGNNSLGRCINPKLISHDEPVLWHTFCLIIRAHSWMKSGATSGFVLQVFRNNLVQLRPQASLSWRLFTATTLFPCEVDPRTMAFICFRVTVLFYYIIFGRSMLAICSARRPQVPYSTSGPLVEADLYPFCIFHDVDPFTLDSCHRRT